MRYFCILCQERIMLAKLTREKRLQKLQREKKIANLTKQDLLFCFGHDHAIQLACIWGSLNVPYEQNGQQEKQENHLPRTAFLVVALGVCSVGAPGSDLDFGVPGSEAVLGVEGCECCFFFFSWCTLIDPLLFPSPVNLNI